MAREDVTTLRILPTSAPRSSSAELLSFLRGCAEGAEAAGRGRSGAPRDGRRRHEVAGIDRKLFAHVSHEPLRLRDVFVHDEPQKAVDGMVLVVAGVNVLQEVRDAGPGLLLAGPLSAQAPWVLARNARDLHHRGGRGRTAYASVRLALTLPKRSTSSQMALCTRVKHVVVAAAPVSVNLRPPSLPVTAW